MEGGSGGRDGGGAPNPFVHELRLTGAQRAKFYLLGTVLAPLRVALAFIVLFLIWPFALLQVLHRSEEELKEPLMDWRSSVSYSSVYLLSRLMFFLLGFMQIRVRGQRASRLEAPILVAAPHSTFFDPIILLPCDIPMVVSRTENLHVPVIGALLRFNQAILVSRHDPASRKKVVEEVKRRATSQGKWPQVLFFPEGTCSNKKALLKFKPGAFIAGVPIQPILVRYPNSLDSTTWAWQGPGVLKVIWLTASQLCTTVEVEFLPVYQPSAEESINPTLYASNVQRAMARALGIPATECELVGTLPVRAVGHLRVALEPRLWELDRALRRARTRGVPWMPGRCGWPCRRWRGDVALRTSHSWPLSCSAKGGPGRGPHACPGRVSVPSCACCWGRPGPTEPSSTLHWAGLSPTMG
ncbi:lysophospholipid acyltransferase LPCAT4 isoform X2 [Chelonia mydas]|uniref:lysophospholipid acyltransferase LPCAT4 isoform X2 n=1 Tax=Chelonia mydas TaxID=8469 RepID=UPI001CA9838E|nr:lysophospholipid acyltransferase LPCAT4 isoform X2 [Chelonia mydas]